jgi:cytosine/adenosine deaminase-related metal-dependent hydrolase
VGGFADPAHLLVGAALPENVDTVVIDGRILKRDGKLTALSAPQVVADARWASPRRGDRVADGGARAAARVAV